MDEKEPDEESDERAEPSPSKPGTLRLPDVVLNDPEKKAAAACPAAKQMDSAVESQEELLAEFQEIAEELQKLISNLEGSTFVKRLKAMSRRELVVANDVTQSSLQGFGEPKKVLAKASVKRTKLIAKRQRAHAESTSGHPRRLGMPMPIAFNKASSKRCWLKCVNWMRSNRSTRSRSGWRPTNRGRRSLRRSFSRTRSTDGPNS